MRHHHDNALARPHADNGARERLVAFGVEIGVGLVEHDQERVAVERARERNALRLAGGQRRTLFADRRSVALGHADDQVMDARGLGGGDDRLRGRMWRKPRNVLRDRSGQQLDVLRQVADMLPERLGRPLIVGRAVEADPAARRLPHADQHAREARLARPARADDAEPVAGVEHEIDVGGDQPLRARRRDAREVDGERLRRRRKRHRRRLGGKEREQLVERVPALPGRGECLPVGDRKVDRGKRARAQNRAGDDDAGGRLLVDHEPGADREHGRLQKHAQHFRGRRKSAGDVAGLLLAGDEFPVGLAPARAQPAVHAHRDQRLGVAPARFGEAVARDAKPDHLLARVARVDLGQVS